MDLVKRLRENQEKFGDELSSGELLMLVQSEEKFPEDDPLEAAKQKRRIRKIKKMREEMNLKLDINGGR
jgi:hypothetical protein